MNLFSFGKRANPMQALILQSNMVVSDQGKWWLSTSTSLWTCQCRAVINVIQHSLEVRVLEHHLNKNGDRVSFSIKIIGLNNSKLFWIQYTRIQFPRFLPYFNVPQQWRLLKQMVQLHRCVWVLCPVNISTTSSHKWHLLHDSLLTVCCVFMEILRLRTVVYIVGMKPAWSRAPVCNGI